MDLLFIFIVAQTDTNNNNLNNLNNDSIFLTEERSPISSEKDNK